jgi:hypothetical protein
MKDQLRELFERYSEAYDRFDPDGAATFITCPLVTVRAGEVAVYDSPEKVRAFLTKLLEWFAGIRHGKSSISKLEVRPPGESSAFVGANIARCCAPCNSSKGTKKLSLWIESNYCKQSGISRETVADIVKEALKDDA